MERDEEERGEEHGQFGRQGTRNASGGGDPRGRANESRPRRGTGTEFVGAPAGPRRLPRLLLSPAMTLIRLEGGTKGFNDRTLFEGVDFELADGERVGLVGRNGSGKSSCSRSSAGSSPPTRGR